MPQIYEEATGPLRNALHPSEEAIRVLGDRWWIEERVLQDDMLWHQTPMVED